MSIGYDYSCTTLSQEGRIYQLEYAEKAIEIAPTVVGIVFSDGVVLASEKIRERKTIVSGSNSTIYNITPTIGMAICGHLPDGRNLVSRARAESQSYLKNFGVDISGRILSDRLAQYVQSHTLYWGMRPFGATAFISSYDKDGNYHLYLVEANGNFCEYYSCTHGKGRQFVKTEVEKSNFALKEKKVSDGLFDVVKVLVRSYEGEKETEYDLSVITNVNNRRDHQIVDKKYADELIARAKADVKQEREMQVDS